MVPRNLFRGSFRAPHFRFPKGLRLKGKLPSRNYAFLGMFPGMVLLLPTDILSDDRSVLSAQREGSVTSLPTKDAAASKMLANRMRGCTLDVLRERGDSHGRRQGDKKVDMVGDASYRNRHTPEPPAPRSDRPEDDILDLLRNERFSARRRPYQMNKQVDI
jgi:hypothetical protein